jgi:pimeloyl-ACP methyl ester carboxylesterase
MTITNSSRYDHPGVSRRTLLGAGAAAAGLVLSVQGNAMQPTPSRAPVSGYAPVDGLNVYYEIHGGPLAPGVTPMVLIHGGMMAIETAFAGRSLLRLLAANAPVIALELQGHAHTGDRPGPITVERLADDAAGVLAHLGVQRAHFVGHSLGGMTSIGAAVRHPERVASLTAISAMYQLEGFLPELVTMQRNPTHTPSAELMPLLPTEADFMAWKAHYDRVAPDPSAFERVLGRLNTMLAQWEGWSHEQLGAIRAPALLAIGDNDFTRVEHAAEMKRLIPNAQLAILPGTTHMSIIDRGEWLAPMMEARITSAD